MKSKKIEIPRELILDQFFEEQEKETKEMIKEINKKIKNGK